MTSSWHSLIPFLPFSVAANSENSTQFSTDYCSVLLQLLNSQFHSLISVERRCIHTLLTLLCSYTCYPESESYVTTDGQPASLSWNKAPIWGLRPGLYFCLTIAGLLISGALSDERPTCYPRNSALLYRRGTDHASQKTQPLQCWMNVTAYARTCLARAAKQRSVLGPQKTLLLYCWPRVFCGRCLAVGRYVTVY
jgi:hypothetical protein